MRSRDFEVVDGPLRSGGSGGSGGDALNGLP